MTRLQHIEILENSKRCLPEEERLEIGLQEADVDIGGWGGGTGAAAPTLELCAACEGVSAEYCSAERSWRGMRENNDMIATY
jgi:hypothetical protein